MRTIVFYIQLLFLLLCGTPGYYAIQQQSNSLLVSVQNPDKKFNAQSDSKQIPVIVADVDVDQEEDLQNNNDYKKQKDNPFFLLIVGGQNNWHNKHLALIKPKNGECKNYHNFSFCVATTPIYLAQRVLRI